VIIGAASDSGPINSRSTPCCRPDLRYTLSLVQGTTADLLARLTRLAKPTFTRPLAFLVGDRLRGVVCGRCDNPYTIGAMENIFIVGDTLYFTIAHEDWGESNPPRFGRNIVAQIVQNEMIASILGKDLVIDPANPPARPAGRGFTLVGSIGPEGTRGNSSEGVDVWGPGTGSAIQPPPGRTPIGR
jgi:hypothetical protein